MHNEHQPLARSATPSALIPSKQSEALLRLSIEHIEDFTIFAVDLDGNAASWNPGVYKLLGYQKAEFLGLNMGRLFTPEDNALEACAHELAVAREQGRAEDQRWHVRQDGTRFWANGLMMALRDEAGTLRGYSKIMRDDTARQQMAASLQQAGQRTHHILESIPVAFFTLDHEWRFTYLNAQGEPLLRRTRAELLGKNMWEEFPEAVGSVFDAQYHKAVAEQVPTICDAFYAPLNSWFEVRAHPSPDGLTVYFHDITERKRSEAALLERTRLAEMNAAVGQAVTRNESLASMLALCAEAMVQHLDAAFARIWTLNREDNMLELKASRGLYTHLDGPHSRVPVGQFKIGLIAEERQPHLTNEVLSDPRVSDHEWAKREGMVAFAGYPLIVVDTLVGVVAIFSRQPLGEATLQGMASAADTMALGLERKRNEAEREQLLNREQLARQAAEENNRLKDEFLSTLSHELRTPLTAILGWAHLLSSAPLDASTTTNAIATIERNARAQVKLIDDLLDISRIITGKLRLDVHKIELSEVIQSAVAAVRPAAEGKSIRLQVLLDPLAGPISGDADRLQQVMWNLLTNAIKFTPKQGRVQVRLERINSHIEVVVSDTGRGIEPAFLPHVFDRFRQADQASTRAIGGLGLGLSIVRQLVELHGGTVQADSAGVDQGATFTVQLPLMVTRREVATPERRHPTVGGQAILDCPPQLDGLRVLVVDDEADTRALLRAMLENCGSLVTTAASVAEALQMMAECKPDILISDIGMPAEDGYALIGKVRALESEHGGRVPAIALTAYARVEDRVRALMAGFQVHVPKPIEPVELIAVVASLAGRTGL